MDKNLIPQLIKTALFGVFWAIVGLALALILINKTSYSLKDTLFIEGILLVVVSVLSSLGGNSTGLSINGMGMNNATLTSSVNLEITKREREKNSMKQTILFGLSSLSLIVGGILLIIINFII